MEKIRILSENPQKSSVTLSVANVEPMRKNDTSVFPEILVELIGNDFVIEKN